MEEKTKMAKNWMVAEAYKEIVAGNKDAIADIGGRFPITTTALGMIGENAGASMVFGALDFVTVRKVEAVLKEDVKPIEEDQKQEKKVAEPASGDKPKGKRGRKPKQKTEEPVVEPVKEEKKKKEEPEEDYGSMSEVELFKVCKAKGLKPAPKQDKKYYLNLLNPVEEAEADDDSDDWDDEEAMNKPEEDPVEDADDAEDEDDDWDI